MHGCTPLTTATAPAPTVPLEGRRRRGTELVESASAHLAHLLDAGRQIECQVTAESGAEALVRLSATASIVVVERRTISGLHRLHTGSTTARVCAQASSPVAVVRSGSDDLADRVGIAVGIDSRGHAHAALQVAFAEASLRQQPLMAVHAWEMPGPITSYTYIPACPEELAVPRERAAAELAEALAGYGEEFPDVVVRRHLVQAAATDALLDAATRAAVLVVGRHGQHAVASIGLGGVARHCLQHAQGPVIVAPPSRAPRRPARWLSARSRYNPSSELSSFAWAGRQRIR